jgi:hypothetical protein
MTFRLYEIKMFTCYHTHRFDHQEDCGMCQYDITRARIQKQFDDTKTDKELASKIKKTMLIPMANRLSAIMPSVLKKEWIETPVPCHSTHKDVFIQWFQKLCNVINAETYEFRDASTAIHKCTTEIHNMSTWSKAKRRNWLAINAQENDSYALVLQSEIIMSADPIFTQLRDTLDLNFMAWTHEQVDRRMKRLAYDMWSYGAEDHAHDVMCRIEAFTETIPPTNREAVLQRIAEVRALMPTPVRQLAIMMALNKRLGHDSRIAIIGADLLAMCARFVQPDKLFFWE